MKHSMRVLISGAGIAGPALAWFLAKGGSQVTVVEKAPNLLSNGQNIDVNGSAIQLLRKMGLLDEVRRMNTTEKGTQFIDPKGRPFASFPVKEGKSVSPTSEYEILRGDLAVILYEATKELPNITYLFDITVKDVITNNDDTVQVRLSNGDVQEYDVLVAADGQWSRLRKQCFPAESVTIVDKGMYCVYFTVPRLPSDNNMWNVYHGLGSRVISLRPDPHNTIRATLACMPCNEAQTKAWNEACRSDRKSQHELAKRHFADAGWQTQRLLDAMDQAPDFYFHAIQQVRMTTWSQSRIVCLGDAAFAPTPLSGMGTSLALLGAYVLAGELTQLQDGEHPSKAFAAYETTFRPFVKKIQDIPSFVPAVAHPETALKRWLLQTCLWAVSKVVALPFFPSQSSENNDEGFPLPKYPSLEMELQGEK